VAAFDRTKCPPSIEFNDRLHRNPQPAVLGRLKGQWKQEFERWQQRDLSARRYVYVWADGVYLQARMEVEKQCPRRDYAPCQGNG